MIIRPINEDDIPELARLAAKTYIETFGYSFTEEELDAQIKETRSEKYFCSAIVTDTILLAFVDKRLAGYIQLSDVKLDVQGVQVTRILLSAPLRLYWISSRRLIRRIIRIFANAKALRPGQRQYQRKALFRKGKPSIIAAETPETRNAG